MFQARTMGSLAGVLLLAAIILVLLPVVQHIIWLVF